MQCPLLNIDLIPLTKGKFAIVDKGDGIRLSLVKWGCNRQKNQTYAMHTYRVGYKTGFVLMHRVIIHAMPGDMVDHINGNGLDNRKCNLRICTSSQNNYNSKPKKNIVGRTSKYKGVSWVERTKGWKANICKNGIRIHLGYYKREMDAAYSYDLAARKLFGQFAYVNFQKTAEAI